MKKILSMLLLLLAVTGYGLVFTACGDDESRTEPPPPVLSSELDCVDEASLYCVDGKIVIPDVAVHEGSGKSIIEETAVAESGESYTLQFRDLNANGTVDPYEDWRLSLQDRIDNLIELIDALDPLDEVNPLLVKGGLLYNFYLGGGANADGTLNAARIADINGTTGFTRSSMSGTNNMDATTRATYANNLQAACESAALGIPYLYNCDPSTGTGSNRSSSVFEKRNNMNNIGNWPFNLGFAAIGDPEYMEEIAALHRAEYKAAGINFLLGPMCDPLGEPRWARSHDTFGATGANGLAGEMARAYIRGLQGAEDGFSGRALTGGVAATLKHFPGAGTNNGGMDSHNYIGRFAMFPGGNFQSHLDNFRTAFEAGPLAVMPCYSIFVTGESGWPGTDSWVNSGVGEEFAFDEHVGSSYDSKIMWDLLRDYCEWDGMVTSDWGVLYGETYWIFQAAYGLYSDDLAGVEEATLGSAEAYPYESYRVRRYARAGGHQIGAGNEEMWINAVSDGQVTNNDVNEAAAKVLEVMFRLGLFENPYIDVAAAAQVVESNRPAAEEAMKRACVLVKNEGEVLPLSLSTDATIYVDSVGDATVDESEMATFVGTNNAMQYTTDINEADIIVLRIAGRQGQHTGIAGGVPLSWTAPVLRYNYDAWRHYTWDEHVALVNSTAGPEGSDNGAGTTEVDGVDYSSGGYIVNDNQMSSAVNEYAKLTNAIAVKNATGARLIVVVFAFRPFVLEPAVAAEIDALVVEFGLFNPLLFDVLFAVDGYAPEAHLPFSIPSSEQSVEDATEDLYNDEVNPTFTFGTGLTW